MKTLTLILTLAVAATARAQNISNYDVVWDSPSKDSWGSMPIGNGDIGANVWVEPSGDLVLLLSKTDAWSGNGRLLKLGRVRIKTEPAICQPGSDFKQRLDLKSGMILIQDSIRVWIDAHQPVIRVEIDRAEPVTVTVQHETWRKERRQLKGRELISAYGLVSSPTPVWVEADTVLDDQRDRIVFLHRNEQSIWESTLRVQALDELVKPGADPLLHRTFGAMVQATGLVNDGKDQLISKSPVKQCVISIFPHTAQTPTVEDWVKQATQSASVVSRTSLDKSRAAHESWWREFWERSWIEVTGSDSIPLPEKLAPWRVGVDSNGQSRFRGEITGPRVIGRALSAEEIAKLADEQPATGKDLQEEPVTTACTLVAWVKPAAGETGRILETATATKPDGFLFDTHPGLSLRWTVGRSVLAQPGCLHADQWQHVAAVVDSRSGRQELYVNGKLIKTASADPVGHKVTSGYVLQRWMNACSGRGAFPIKFNGSIFNVDVLRPIMGYGPYDADFRAWGGGYWFQNTRLPYWSMLAAGDHDLMPPLFQMYMDALPLRKAATKKYYKHDGAFYPETMYFWGTYNNDNYGWNRTGKPDGLTDNQFIRYYWQGGLELTSMMVEYYEATGDKKFRDETLLPFAHEIVTFFDQHWPRAADGKILFSPAMALETWWTAINPTPDVAGLRFVLPRLIELTTDSKQKVAWQKTFADLPPIPVGGAGDERRVLPAESFSNKRNAENPELYAVFPYRHYGVGKPDIELAREAYRRRLNRGTGGWFQNAIHAALLGLTDEAQSFVTTNFKATASGFRFQAMWGPNFDWVPDQDHGSVSMIALQAMLLQTDGDKILLLPAWPKDWDVEFKLHAPQNTTIEGVYRNGKMEKLTVSPQSRQKDVVIGDEPNSTSR